MDLEQLLALGAAVSKELDAEKASGSAVTRPTEIRPAASPAPAAPAAARPAAPSPATAPATAQRPASERTIKPSTALWTLPGFGDEARVVTSFGELPMKALRVRDPLRTAEGEFVPVQWVDRLHLDEGFLHGMPDAHPIRIAAGALGRDRPKSEMVVSPHQMIATSEVQFRNDFRSARELLTGRPGILRLAETGMTYTMFHCGRPVTVMVEGVWVRVEP